MDGMSLLLVIILSLFVAYFLLRGPISRDKTLIWSPMTTISLTYLYYCIIPFFYSIDRYSIDEALHKGYLFHFVALLSFFSIIIGYGLGPSFNMKKWNTLFKEERTDFFGVFLFIFALLCYVPFRGFHITFASSSENDDIQLLSGGFVYYMILMIDIFAAAAGLLLFNRQKSSWWKLFPLWIILSTFLFAGARWRIVVTVITSLTIVHLFPRPKKANYPLIIALMIIIFLGFSLMDQTRQYGRGINMEKAGSLHYNDIRSGAGENYSVYAFSLLSIEQLYETHKRYYFEPLGAALTMPIPRFLYPGKPNAEYIHQMERMVLGQDTGGAAFLFFVEGFLSFGWLGVIIYGLILGSLAKGVWQNYRHHSNSIGAILLLGLFSGVCYCIISRGYLPGTVSNVVYVVCLPFWLCAILNRIRERRQR